MFLSSPAKKKAVAYYRHSAEDRQENSVAIQREHAEKFAKEHSIEIIHEEADEGISGLTENRLGFKRLLDEWILSPDAPQFDYVLVYDVSRWGRFQNPNKGAHYQFLCEEKNKKVIYVSRGFPKEEQQLISHLQTSVEQYMAADYSKQLSGKTYHGCAKVSEQGYSAGGMPTYGMVRVLLDIHKQPVRILERGEWKSIANERVTFTPRNDETTRTVQEIFTLHISRWYTPREIADELNERRIPSASGSLWNAQKVVRVLTNETYTGTRIYNKTWQRLKQKSRPNPRSEWIIRKNAFPAIVDQELFEKAQEHMYWLMLSKWKRGIYAMRKIKKLLEKEIEALLIHRGVQLTDSVGVRIPITYSVSFYLNGKAHWCFAISEQMRNFDSVIGIAIDLDRKDIDRFFTMPTTAFNSFNYIVFSEDEDRYVSYKLERNSIEERILSFFDKELSVAQ
ncbi:MAG: recombinase family protein [Patescibacteria group bacterium]